MLYTLCKEKRASKGWWRVAGRIMENRGGQKATPVLRNSDAVWVRDPDDKGNFLARTFPNKFVITALIENEFSFEGARSVVEAFVLSANPMIAKPLARLIFRAAPALTFWQALFWWNAPKNCHYRWRRSFDAFSH